VGPSGHTEYNMATRQIGEMPLLYPDVDLYFKRLQFYLIATDQESKAKAVLLSTCGERSFRLISTLMAPADLESKDVTFSKIQTAVIDHLKPRLIIHYERHLLHTMMQNTEEDVSCFLERLKQQANKCEFGTLLDDLLLSQFIFGLRSQETRSKLLAMSSLTLTIAVQEAQLHETITMSDSSQPSISTLRSTRSFKQHEAVNSHRFVRQEKLPACMSCGKTTHRRADCRFRNATCFKCNRVGHIQTVCRAPSEPRSISFVDEQECANSGESSIAALEVSMAKMWYERCFVNGKPVDFLVDTGSEATILPQDTVENLGLVFETYSGPYLRAYGGSQVPVLGKIDNASIKAERTRLDHRVSILVTGLGTKAILGMDSLPQLGLVQTTCAPITVGDEVTASLRLKSDATLDGMVYPARSLPFSMKVLVEAELKRLLAAGVIERCENPKVAAPIVPVIKTSPTSTHPIRLCGDYSRTINKIIDPGAYRMPKLEEILTKTTGAKFYTVLDLHDAYLQVNLDRESQYLTCISTHMGYFTFTKLQFGISAAPLIFQEIMDKVLAGIPNVSSYQDDILIATPTREAHDITLQCVRQRLSKHGFKINGAKSQVCVDAVKFLGFLLSDGKLIPHPDRLKALEQMPFPRNKDELRSLLGALRHYGHFCRNFSLRARDLYSLLKRDSRWEWSDRHRNAVIEIKSEIMKGIITAYDIRKPLYISCDASQRGIGYVLSHDREQKNVVWLGSRILAKAEMNYSNIEREALAIVEAVKYFHQFIAARKFTILSDHAPLRFILGKGQSERVSARLQRWAIVLKSYDFTVEYTRPEKNCVADSLSRLPMRSDSVVPVVNLLNIRSLEEFSNGETLLKIISESKDPVLLRLKRFITQGWPSYVPDQLKSFSKGKEEYSVQSGVIYRGLRVVPPRSLRQRVLYVLHENHPGIVKMIRLARQYFWWPGIDADINAFVQRCTTCQIHARKRTNANLSSWDEATNFLERLHIDVAYFKGHKMLVLVDAYSKWVDVHQVRTTTAAATIAALRQTFKYVGLPQAIVTDNGTNFSSADFAKFLERNFIRHIRTPPGHHQSNGQVERVIQELKFALRKVNGVDSDNLQKAIASFCLSFNTGPACNGAVPGAMVFLKTPRTLLSTTCTEKLNVTPLPVYIRVEGQIPRQGHITDVVGSNTSTDDRGRLVHDADVTSRPEAVALSSSSEASPQTVQREEQCEREATESGNCVVSARSRPQRIRRVPVRYGYDN